MICFEVTKGEGQDSVPWNSNHAQKLVVEKRYRHAGHESDQIPDLLLAVEQISSDHSSREGPTATIRLLKDLFEEVFPCTFQSLM